MKSDDGVGTTTDGGGEHVPVLGIARHLVNEVIKLVNERLGAEGFPHHRDPTARVFRWHPDLRKCPVHLVQDLFRPQWLKQAGLSEPEERGGKPDRDESACVEDGNWAGSPSADDLVRRCALADLLGEIMQRGSAPVGADRAIAGQF